MSSKTSPTMTPNSMANKFASPTSLPPVVPIGITGGIASGKSYVCRQLEAAGHPVFYCDAEAKRIIRTDPAVRRELTSLVGPEVYAADGQLVKSVLAAWLCRSRSHAAQVDAIVRPRVADAFAARAAAIALGAAPWTESEVQAAAILLQPSQRETDIAALAALPAPLAAALARGETVPLTIQGTETTLAPDEVVIRREPREGLVVAAEGNIVVALETALTAALLAEGLMREFVSRVQALRKEADLEVTQRIEVTFQADDEVAAALDAWQDTILEEVQGDALLPGELTTDPIDLNGHELRLLIEAK